MTEHSLWRFSRALHRAINERQFDDLEALIDDDVDWAIYGPIDMFPFFGARRGKAAVIEVIRQIADNVRVHRFDREIVMLGRGFGGLDAALFADGLDSNKPISLRVAHFAQFKAGRLPSFRVLVDTFDLVEQASGYPIHLPRWRCSDTSSAFLRLARSPQPALRDRNDVATPDIHVVSWPAPHDSAGVAWRSGDRKVPP